MQNAQAFTLVALAVYAIAMAVSFIIVPAVSFFTKNKEKEELRTEEIFSCYDEEM